MKKTVLFLTLLIFTTIASAEKVSQNLHTEGDWCKGTYMLVADFGKKEGTWHWTFNGKTLYSETSQSINMATYGVGKYTVSLKDASGNIVASDAFELATLPGPKADFGYDFLYAAGAVEFTNMTTSNTTELTWTWDFGDGSTATDQNPTHFYKAEGTYTIKLTATDASGCSNTVSLDILWKYPGN